ncbi:hypothetical protein L9F63_008691, partial [Diploptera punctata]
DRYRSFDAKHKYQNIVISDIKDHNNDVSSETWDTISIPVQNSFRVTDYFQKNRHKGEIEEIGDPEEELSGFYSECVSKFSYTCIQRKILSYIRRVSALERYDLIGDRISVVRVTRNVDSSSRIDVRSLNDVATLDSLLDDAIIGFFRSHVLRVKLPSWSAVAVAGSGESAREDAAVDFSLGNSAE